MIMGGAVMEAWITGMSGLGYELTEFAHLILVYMMSVYVHGLTRS